MGSGCKWLAGLAGSKICPLLAAVRVLNQLTGLHDVYMEQLQAFSRPDRDPVERTVAVAYVALIDIQKYQAQINDDFHARWFSIDKLPNLIFDHDELVKSAKSRLRYKAALHPILFELLPAKFTLPYLQAMYESLFGTSIDKRNFTKKILSTNMLIKDKEKDKTGSKKGAYYFRLDKLKYEEESSNVLNFIPKAELMEFDL